MFHSLSAVRGAVSLRFSGQSEALVLVEAGLKRFDFRVGEFLILGVGETSSVDH